MCLASRVCSFLFVVITVVIVVSRFLHTRSFSGCEDGRLNVQPTRKHVSCCAVLGRCCEAMRLRCLHGRVQRHSERVHSERVQSERRQTLVASRMYSESIGG